MKIKRNAVDSILYTDVDDCETDDETADWDIQFEGGFISTWRYIKIPEKQVPANFKTACVLKILLIYNRTKSLENFLRDFLYLSITFVCVWKLRRRCFVLIIRDRCKQN